MVKKMMVMSTKKGICDERLLRNKQISAELYSLQWSGKFHLGLQGLSRPPFYLCPSPSSSCASSNSRMMFIIMSDLLGYVLDTVPNAHINHMLHLFQVFFVQPSDICLYLLFCFHKYPSGSIRMHQTDIHVWIGAPPCGCRTVQSCIMASASRGHRWYSACAKANLVNMLKTGEK